MIGIPLATQVKVRLFKSRAWEEPSCARLSYPDLLSVYSPGGKYIYIWLWLYFKTVPDHHPDIAPTIELLRRWDMDRIGKWLWPMASENNLRATVYTSWDSSFPIPRDPRCQGEVSPIVSVVVFLSAGGGCKEMRFAH